MITIRRNLTAVTDVNPLTSSTQVKAVMGEEQITLAWEQAQFTELHIGDYIEYEGSLWTLNSLPTVKKNSSRSFRYDALFQSTKYDIAKAVYLLFDNTSTPPPPGEIGEAQVIPPKGEFSMTGNAPMFMELLVANLNRVAGYAMWSLGQVVEDTDYITLTFSNEDCLSVLGRIADEFDTEYHVSNRLIHLKRISTARELTLEYGSTLYDVERASANSSGPVTRLYPYGSTRNLPGNYRGGNMPLCIPEALGQYIESDKVSLYGIIEESKTFDEIYPRLSSGGAGIITSIGILGDAATFTFTDSALDFDVNDCLLDGTKAKVHFNTGQCAGYDFEIQRYSHSTKTFTLIPNKQENDYTLPSENIRPAVGDQYVLLDIAMPESYRVNAEEELADKAVEWLEQNDTQKVTYKATFSAIYARQNLQNIECGDMVRLRDPELGIDEGIRIVKLTKGIADYWTVQFDLSDTVTKTTLEHITGDIATVQNELVTSNARINENTRRSYLNTKELREMVFDTDGYFDPENIKPLSIETSMLSVGARPQAFQLSILLQPNYAGNPQVLQWSAGVLAHFTLDDSAVLEWVIPQGSITIAGSNQTIGLYIYARCSRTTSSGTIFLDAAQYRFDEDPDYWYFLVGVLHSPVDGVRGISLTYGQTAINGRFIKTGRVQSADGQTYFDLDSGTIQGNIRFTSGQSAEDYIDGAIDSIDVGGENLLTHNPENWELGTFNATTGAQTSSTTNIRTKSMVPFAANKDHIINRFGSGTLYAYEYTGSGGTGFVKMTTITTFPLLIPKQASARYYKFRIATSNLNLLGSTYKYKVEQGNIPTDWAVPSLDIQSTASNALTSAADALAAATDAQTQALLLSYLQDALNNDTTIQGGLIATSLIRLGAEVGGKDWVESAGLYGGASAQGDNTPRIWGGGTFEGAIERVNSPSGEGGAKCVITHGGRLYAIDVQLMGSLSTALTGQRIVLDQDNNQVTLFDASNNPKAVITASAIPSIESMLSASSGTATAAMSVNITASAGGSNSDTKQSNLLTLPSTAAAYTVTTPPVEGTISLNVTAAVAILKAEAEIKVIFEQISGGGGLGANGTRTVFSEKFIQADVGNRTIPISIPSKKLLSIPPGTYRLKIYGTVSTGPTGTASINVAITSPNHILSGAAPVDVSYIHRDGVFLVQSANDYMYLNPSGIAIKSQKAPDVPGVLLVGEVNTLGNGNKFWGPKVPSGTASIRNSTGVYTVNHAIGHENYVVQVSLATANRTAVVSAKTATSFVVTTYSGTTASNTGFEFGVFGNN